MVKLKKKQYRNLTEPKSRGKRLSGLGKPNVRTMGLRGRMPLSVTKSL